MSRIALMVPHTDTTLEWDLQRALAGRYSVHTQRLWLDDVSETAEETMLRVEVPRAAAYLRPLAPDLLVFGCTSAGAIRGAAGDRRFTAWLAEAVDAPVVSAFGGVVRDLERRAGAAPVQLITPYTSALHARMAGALVDAGVRVTGGGCMGLSDDCAIGRVEPAAVTAFAAEQIGYDAAPAHLFVSCTNLRAAECADALAARLGLEVTTSNSAILARLNEHLGSA